MLAVVSSTRDSRCTTSFDQNDERDYFIRQVSTKAGALDVEVFRGSAIPAQEYVLEQQQLLGRVISEEEAIELLTINYDEDGRYMSNTPQYEPEINFVAMFNGTESAEKSSFARQNGIIGVVSAQLRRRSPLIAGPSTTSDDDDSSTALPSVRIPSPHVYIANMKVDDKFRRRGVGMALLSSVREYANSWTERMGEEIPLVLSADNDNTGAIRLYEKFGFAFLEQNDVFCMMTLTSNCCLDEL